jgi:hypothetical protein
MAHTDAERKRQQRERTQRHRDKIKAQSAIDAVANEQKSRDEFDSWRVSQRLVSPGEIEAFVNAESLADAIISCREFLAALHQPDIMVNESLLSAERRVIEAWIKIGAPLLSRNSLRFAEETGSTIDGFAFDFDGRWLPLSGAHDLIDVATLPAIVIPAADTPAAVPAVLTPATPSWDDPAFKNYRTPEVIAICKAQQERCDANARAIGKKNLQRELEKEKRLGPVAYAYEQ